MVRLSCSVEARQLIEVTPAEVIPSLRLFSMFSSVPFGSTWEKLFYFTGIYLMCCA